MHTTIIPRLIAAASLLLTITLTQASNAQGGQCGTPGRGAPFTAIYAFGDSLTDTGNFFDLTGLPPAPYFEGRFSNGPVWIEFLAESMGMNAESVENYAVGGATTGRENENDIPGVIEFPGLQDELDVFEQELNGRKADKRALYVIWAGANDFLVATGTPEETIARAIGNTIVAIQRLHQAGARRFLVVNLPDLGLTPFGGASGNAAGLSFLSAAYNGTLTAALDQLAASSIQIAQLDSAGLLQSMVASPAEYGFTNVSDAFLSTGGDPDAFLYWDALHPTSLGHFHVAEEALLVLRNTYRHAWITPRKRR